jgi:hypothetical protein
MPAAKEDTDGFASHPLPAGDLVRAVLRNLPLRQPSVLTAKSLRHVLQVSEGLTAKIFAMLNARAIKAIEAGREQIRDAVVLKWSPVVKPEATYS